MPDKWEYPWYAAWDLAFHCIALALVDPDFAKEQLVLMLREWYMHPNGQLAGLRVGFRRRESAGACLGRAGGFIKIDKKRARQGRSRISRALFHKLLLNFTWWVNRKDADGMNVFQGGFLGLDNIGVFDRSAPLPDWRLSSSNPTARVGWRCTRLNLLAIAHGTGAEQIRLMKMSPASSGSTSCTSLTP